MIIALRTLALLLKCTEHKLYSNSGLIHHNIQFSPEERVRRVPCAAGSVGMLATVRNVGSTLESSEVCARQSIPGLSADDIANVIKT
jgi:hypothetical protein